MAAIAAPYAMIAHAVPLQTQLTVSPTAFAVTFAATPSELLLKKSTSAVESTSSKTMIFNCPDTVPSPRIVAA